MLDYKKLETNPVEFIKIDSWDSFAKSWYCNKIIDTEFVEFSRKKNTN